MVKSQFLLWHMLVRQREVLIDKLCDFRDVEVAYEFLTFLRESSTSTVCIHTHKKEYIHQQTSIQIF